ncbi:MAG: peptidoglycan-binding protein, partial [Acetatifactor sp.]|nr:peptidoglycan-binding protein [Acetatifactor sp.]
TITVSATKNRKHPVVLPIQKKLKRLGWYMGDLDCTAGPKFTAAVNGYQKQVLRYSKTDDEITKGNKMWRSMLGMG